MQSVCHFSYPHPSVPLPAFIFFLLPPHNPALSSALPAHTLLPLLSSTSLFPLHSFPHSSLLPSALFTSPPPPPHSLVCNSGPPSSYISPPTAPSPDPVYIINYNNLLAYIVLFSPSQRSVNRGRKLARCFMGCFGAAPPCEL